MLRKIFLVVTFFIFSTSQSFAAAIQLPQTGQTRCYSGGAIIDCAGTGQDGEFQMGVPWPSPKLIYNNDRTVSDRLTGLVWTADDYTPGPPACNPGISKTWYQALDHVVCLNANNYLGYNDWRLPNFNELRSVVQGYGRSGDRIFWSSTTDTRYADTARTVREDYYFPFPNGNPGNWKMNNFGVWPVRSGCDGKSTICLPKTGQIQSYAVGDDGDLQTGVAWPSPRFIVNSDQTITDNLTGLTWTNGEGRLLLNQCARNTATWQESFEIVACLNSNNYLGYNDWRVPNAEELFSRVDLSTSSLFLGGWVEWSSTTNHEYESNAWLVTWWGGLSSAPKFFSYEFWPVRGRSDNIPPIAKIGPVQMIILGEAITLDGSASNDPDGTIATYQWNFGDGTSVSSTAVSVHTYMVAGSYQVTLTVTDNAGGMNVTSTTVIVETPANAISNVVAMVQDMNIMHGIENSLDAKLQAAVDALSAVNSGSNTYAISKLQAFINEAQAQSGKKLTIAQANQLIAAANRIIATLR